jgi:protein TonB
MQIQNHPGMTPGGTAPPPPDLNREVERIFAVQTARKPWLTSFLDNVKEAISPTKLPPLHLSARPLTQEELLNSDDPYLRHVAEIAAGEKNFLASLRQNIAELINPPKLPPLQLTSRPVTEEELGSMHQAAGRISLPWYRTFFKDVKEAIFPPKLPPLDVTSRPVQVKEIFAKDEYRGGSQVMSVLVHVGVVALAFILGTNPAVQKAVKSVSVFTPTDIAAYEPKMAAKDKAMGGGGGGGDRSPLPASKGRLPRPALKQFTPPVAVINNPNPRLIMEPTIIAPPDVPLPQVNMAQYGDPLAKMGPASNGPGSGGGIGSGSGGGVGSGRGGGYGPGEGGGVGGGAYKIGGGVSAPVPIFKVEPEYSEEARKAKFQGTVLLAIVVTEDGRTSNVRVLRPLGMGLDEKAVEAVMKWRFKPGYKDGHAVPVQANVEVNFRLL